MGSGKSLRYGHNFNNRWQGAPKEWQEQAIWDAGDGELYAQPPPARRARGFRLGKPAAAQVLRLWSVDPGGRRMRV